MNQQNVKEILQKATKTILDGLNEAIPNALSKVFVDAYNEGWRDCMAFYHIDERKFLENEEKAERESNRM